MPGEVPATLLAKVTVKVPAGEAVPGRADACDGPSIVERQCGYFELGPARHGMLVSYLHT